jgi:Na+/proline symporter
MRLTTVDWAVIVGFFAVNLLIGFAFGRRAGKSTNEFFLSGRNVPWWLAGTSMVATTFGADTPLAVSGMVVRHGVAGNWLWWNAVASGMLTVFFFAALWRRAGVMTDVELVEIRYAGRAASGLRAFRAAYLALPINCIILGWVNLAMAKILDLTLGLPKTTSIAVCLALTGVYTAVSGLWGVLVTDVLQFVVKLGMTIVLAVSAVRAAGGIDHIRAVLPAERLQVLPPLDAPWMPAIALAVYLGVQWWAAWYPGAEPGGGGYVAQRIFAAKSERDGVLATLWFATGKPMASDRRDHLLDAAREQASSHALTRTAGCSSPHAEVVILRVLAPRVEPAMQLLSAVWARWREVGWGLCAVPPRVWRT